MRHILILGSLFFLLPLFGKPLFLDDVMSKEEQKRTGVIYLTPNQRGALEVWINQNCNCAPENLNQATNLYLSINISNGQKIQLNDGSIWEVDPRDRAVSEAWLASIPLKVVPSQDLDFPYLLVNKNTGVSVRARKSVIELQTPPYQPPAQPSTPPPPQAKTPPPAAPSKVGPPTKP